MKLREIYFKTDLSIDRLAQLIRSILKTADVQKRHGINRGGLYYYFEVIGFTMLLLPNANEAEIPERSGWPYYMIVYNDEMAVSETVRAVIIEYIASIIKQHGIETDVDCLS